MTTLIWRYFTLMPLIITLLLIVIFFNVIVFVYVIICWAIGVFFKKGYSEKKEKKWRKKKNLRNLLYHLRSHYPCPSSPSLLGCAGWAGREGEGREGGVRGAPLDRSEGAKVCQLEVRTIKAAYTRRQPVIRPHTPFTRVLTTWPLR